MHESPVCTSERSSTTILPWRRIRIVSHYAIRKLASNFSSNGYHSFLKPIKQTFDITCHISSPYFAYESISKDLSHLLVYLLSLQLYTRLRSKPYYDLITYILYS